MRAYIRTPASELCSGDRILVGSREGFAVVVVDRIVNDHGHVQVYRTDNPTVPVWYEHGTAYGMAFKES